MTDLTVEALRALALAGPEPACYRLYVDADTRAAVEACSATLDALRANRDDLARAPADERRGRSLAGPRPLAELDAQILQAEGDLADAERAAVWVELRFMPPTPDEDQAMWMRQAQSGEPVTLKQVRDAQAALCYRNAYSPDGVALGIDWGDLRLHPMDHRNILLLVADLCDHGMGAPFVRGSSGQPAPSSPNV